MDNLVREGLFGYILSIRGEFGCFCVVSYIAWTYFRVKRQKTIAHRLFSSLLIVTLINFIFDVITVYTVNFGDVLPLFINRGAHVIFVSSITTILFIIYMYIRVLAYKDFQFKWYWLIPLVASILAVTFLPFSYEESHYGNYSSGPFLTVAFVCSYTYFFLGAIILFRNRKKLEKKSLQAISLSLAAMFSFTVVQGIWPELLFTSIAITIFNVAFFYTVESPDALMIEMLKDEREKAEAANRAKSTFLAQMSHEIRTPINAILGMNEMILRKSDGEIREYALNINDSGKTLLSLINSILDFSKIEDGKMELLHVEYDTSSVINNLVQSISARAAAKGLELVLDIDPDIPASLVGDDVRVTQIVMNLLTNAVKYTERGSVTLMIRTQQKQENRGLFLVSVKDTGIGIKEEDMDKLALSFQRLELERNRTIEGTGLGIAIVSRLLAMMDSRLRIKSTYGEGSEFSFLLWQDIADETPIGDINKRIEESHKQSVISVGFSAPDAKVLVVDDNLMNLKVAKNLLSLYSIEPDLASSGAEAIELIKNKTYHVVCMDHMMPLMDGIETLKKLKEEDLLPKETVVLMMTANAVVGVKESYLKEGFADYISKPIELARMEEKLEKYLPKDLLKEPGAKDDNKTGAKPGQVSDDKTDNTEYEIMEFPANEGKEDEGSDGSLEERIHRLKEKGFDTDAALAYCTGSPQFYAELLDEFASSSAQKMADLDGMLENGDLHGYATAVHALKSTSRTIGANALSELARELELAADEGKADLIKEKHGIMMELYAEAVSNTK
ncbi:MAG: response regulator [Lachnospiraceae bacterium]|nr:response regulator [Lachnospiraceae bacterium]